LPRLNIDFEARFASVTDALSKIERQTSRSAGQMTSAFSTLKTTIAGIGAGLSVGAITASFANTVKELADLDDAAEATGASVEALSSLLNTLAPTGVGLEQITDIAGKLTRAMTGADEESSKAAAAFRAIGVSTRDASGNLRAVDDVLTDVANALATYADGANKTALAQVLLGRSGAQYLPLLKDLATRQREAATVTKEQAAQAETLANQWRALGRQSDILRQQIAISLVPAVSDLLAKLQSIAAITKNPIQWARFLFGDASNIDNEVSRIEREIGRLTKVVEGGSDNAGGANTRDRAGGLLGRLLGNNNSARDALLQLQRDLQVAKAVQRTQQQLNVSGVAQPRQPFSDARFDKPPREAPNVGGADDKRKQQQTDADRLYRRTLDQLFATQDLTREQQLALDIALDALPVQFRGAEQGAIAAARQADNLTAANAAAKELDATIKEATRVETADNAALENLKREARQSLEREVEGIKSLVDPTREVYKEIERVQQLLSAGLLPRDVGNARLATLYSEVDGILQGVQASVEEVKEAGRDIFAPIESSFESLLFSGAKARDMFAGLLEDIGKLILRQQLLSPFADFLGASFGGGDTSKIGIGTLFGKLLGRASGGPVTGGTPYIVGERGPELFVPGASGAIVPNGKFGRASGGVQIVQNITVDSRSDRASIVQAMQAAKQAAIAEIRDSMNRGGQFA
jgi:hypothetical protein